MISRLLKKLGYGTTEQMMGFLICGLLVLPTILFVGGERNAAAVVMLILINTLLICGIRGREMENLRQTREAAEKRALEQDAGDQDPP